MIHFIWFSIFQVCTFCTSAEGNFMYVRLGIIQFPSKPATVGQRNGWQRSYRERIETSSGALEGGGGRGASARSACRPVSYFQHFDMYFPLVVYFFTQRSLFAKKDYSNTKQRAGQGATKEKSRGGVKGGGKGPGVFQEPKRLDGRRYNIWFISLALSLNFFFLPILYFLHMPIWKHGALNHPLLEKQPPPETSCVCPTLFYLGFFFRFWFLRYSPSQFSCVCGCCLYLHWYSNHQTFTHVSRWRKRSKFEHVCVRVCFAKAKRKWQFSVWHVRSMRVCVFGGWQFPI